MTMNQVVTALARLPDFRGFTPEEMLSNDRLFGTEALNPEFQALVDKRKELLFTRAPSHLDLVDLDFLLHRRDRGKIQDIGRSTMNL
jgi:hypothetical protein